MFETSPGCSNFKKRSTCTRGYFHEGFYVLEAQWCHKPGHWAKTGRHDRDIPNEEMLLPWLTLHWCEKWRTWWDFVNHTLSCGEIIINIPLWMGCIVMHVRQIRSCRKENLLIFLPPKSEWPPGEARVCWNLEDNFCSQSDHRFVQIIQETWQKLPKNYEKILNIRIRCSTSLFTIYRQYYSFCRLSSMAHAEGCNFLAEPKDSTWSCNVGAMRGAQLVAAKSSWNRCWGHFISTNVEIKTTFQMGQPKTKSGFLFIDKFNPSTSLWNTGFQWFGSDCIPFVQESRLLQIQISRLHIINQVNWGSFSPKTIQLPNSAGGYNIVSYDVLGKAYNAYTNGMIQQGMDRVSECCWFWSLTIRMQKSEWCQKWSKDGYSRVMGQPQDVLAEQHTGKLPLWKTTLASNYLQVSCPWYAKCPRVELFASKCCPKDQVFPKNPAVPKKLVMPELMADLTREKETDRKA